MENSFSYVIFRDKGWKDPARYYKLAGIFSILSILLFFFFFFRGKWISSWLLIPGIAISLPGVFFEYYPYIKILEKSFLGRIIISIFVAYLGIFVSQTSLSQARQLIYYNIHANPSNFIISLTLLTAILTIPAWIYVVVLLSSVLLAFKTFKHSILYLMGNFLSKHFMLKIFPNVNLSSMSSFGSFLGIFGVIILLTCAGVKVQDFIYSRSELIAKLVVNLDYNDSFVLGKDDPSRCENIDFQDKFIKLNNDLVSIAHERNGEYIFSTQICKHQIIQK